ncbi:MAG: SagB/ThcOx family dehydrogenase [bacterium]|nr:SagB/ThcOx family dehydrogenase [bacterium]
MNSVQKSLFILAIAIGMIGWIMFGYQFTQTEETETIVTNETTNEVMEEAVEAEEELTYEPIEKSYIGETILMPEPDLVGTVPVETALATRRSNRSFSETALTTSELGQILWSAQGITNEETGYRTAPSAKSIYPINLYVVVRNVDGVEPGLYHYIPAEHGLKLLLAGNNLLLEDDQQDSVKAGAAVLVYGAIYPKIQIDFGVEGGIKVALQESGHIGENIYLQAEALNLSTVVVGGFNPVAVQEALMLAADETVIYLQPLGHDVE